MLLDNPNSNPQTLTLALTLALTLYNQAAGWGVECCSMLLLLLHIYHIRLQPVSHTVASSITYDCSLHHIRLRLQLPSHTVAGGGLGCRVLLDAAAAARITLPRPRRDRARLRGSLLALPPRHRPAAPQARIRGIYKETVYKEYISIADLLLTKSRP